MVNSKVPLRVDFGGGWLDVPKLSRKDSYIVNCAITPMVSLNNWPYKKCSGLGGSAAHAILKGKDPFESEKNLGVGWKDPAIIKETGLCVWKSGKTPMLEMKIDPNFLMDKMALFYTGETHDTPSLVDMERDYDAIYGAGHIARKAVIEKSFDRLCDAVNISYNAQKNEGMNGLPDFGEQAKKYCGGGWGGYALYLFDSYPDHLLSLTKIQPYLK